MRFWISWVQRTNDHRPLTYPPNAAILGWWCSGYDENGDSILCAAVEAKDASTASCALIKEWPELKAEILRKRFNWRFYEHNKGNDWQPGDRFPLSDWMVERFVPAPPPRSEA